MADGGQGGQLHHRKERLRPALSAGRGHQHQQRHRTLRVSCVGSGWTAAQRWPLPAESKRLQAGKWALLPPHYSCSTAWCSLHAGQFRKGTVFARLCRACGRIGHFLVRLRVARGPSGRTLHISEHAVCLVRISTGSRSKDEHTRPDGAMVARSVLGERLECLTRTFSITTPKSEWHPMPLGSASVRTSMWATAMMLVR